MTTQKDLLDSVPTQLFVGGRWRDARGSGTFAVEDPATGRTLTHVADGGVQDGKDALDAAVAAQADWSHTAPRARGEILRTAWEMLTDRADDFALMMTLEMGKTLKESLGEVTYGAEFFRWFAEEAVRISGRWQTAPEGTTRLMTMKRPVGPALMITPWNFPLAMGTRKIGPAIAAGCTMVVKPAQNTPLTMLMLADLLREAGLPDGVLNVVTTTRTGEVCEPLIRDERLRKLTFTGSTDVGRMLMAQSSQRLLRLSMELGGNAPFLVFNDADVDAAVEGAMLAKMRNIGEACTAANRFLVQERVAEEFAEKLARRMSALVVGKGTVKRTDVGPLITAAAVDGVHELVTDAVAKGARVLCGGGPQKGAGHFYAPTVLSEVPVRARLNKEEIFGPVAPVMTFRTESEAVRRANDTEFGLTAYAYTRDLARTIRLSESLEYGMVAINQGLISNAAAPFGGVKSSGFGREGGFEGIEEYLETRYVGIAGIDS